MDGELRSKNMYICMGLYNFIKGFYDKFYPECKGEYEQMYYLDTCAMDIMKWRSMRFKTTDETLFEMLSRFISYKSTQPYTRGMRYILPFFDSDYEYYSSPTKIRVSEFLEFCGFSVTGITMERLSVVLPLFNWKYYVPGGNSECKSCPNDGRKTFVRATVHFIDGDEEKSLPVYYWYYVDSDDVFPDVCDDLVLMIAERKYREGVDEQYLTPLFTDYYKDDSCANLKDVSCFLRWDDIVSKSAKLHYDIILDFRLCMLEAFSDDRIGCWDRVLEVGSQYPYPYYLRVVDGYIND